MNDFDAKERTCQIVESYGSGMYERMRQELDMCLDFWKLQLKDPVTLRTFENGALPVLVDQAVSLFLLKNRIMLYRGVSGTFVFPVIVSQVRQSVLEYLELVPKQPSLAEIMAVQPMSP